MKPKNFAIYVLAVITLLSLSTNTEASRSDALFPVKVQGKWGYVNKAGQIVIEPNLDRVYSYSNGLALVQVGNQFSYIDKNGKSVGQYEE